MSSSGRWGLRDELHFIERGYRRGKHAFLSRYMNGLRFRHAAFCVGALHSRHRDLLMAFCLAVPRCTSAEFIRRHSDSGGFRVVCDDCRLVEYLDG